MADTYEQNLGQKSSLTTSDFIRVVGSDNVSYKQSVANVKDSWGLTFTALTSGSLLTWAEGLGEGEWHFRTNNSMEDVPISYLLGVVYVKDGNRRILAYGMTTTNCYTNFRTNSLAWNGWERQPTRAEMDSAVIGRGVITSLSSDTEIIGMKAGMYQVQLDANSAYLPYRWGVLTIEFNSNYGVATFVTATADTRVYQRVFNRSSTTWYNSWILLPTRAEVDALNSNQIFTNIGYCSDLNISDRSVGKIYFFSYTANSSNTPNSGAGFGFLFVNSDSRDYGRMICISNDGLFTRRLQTGNWQAWNSINTTAVS